MLQEILGWIVLFAVPVAFIALYAVPSTRPYAKKYWWVAVLVAVVGIGLVALRRRPGKETLVDSTKDQEEGHKIAEENMQLFDTIADKARDEMALADVELARKRAESQGDGQKYDTKVAAIMTVDDSLERRKALIKLVESQS